MKMRNVQTGEGNITRVIAWLSIFAMFAFFWIGLAGLAVRILLRRG